MERALGGSGLEGGIGEEKPPERGGFYLLFICIIIYKDLVLIFVLPLSQHTASLPSSPTITSISTSGIATL